MTDDVKISEPMSAERMEFERLKFTRIEVDGVVKDLDTFSAQCESTQIHSEYSDTPQIYYDKLCEKLAELMGIDRSRVTWADASLFAETLQKRTVEIKKNITAIVGSPSSTE